GLTTLSRTCVHIDQRRVRKALLMAEFDLEKLAQVYGIVRKRRAGSRLIGLYVLSSARRGETCYADGIDQSRWNLGPSPLGTQPQGKNNERTSKEHVCRPFTSNGQPPRRPSSLSQGSPTSDQGARNSLAIAPMRTLRFMRRVQLTPTSLRVQVGYGNDC